MWMNFGEMISGRKVFGKEFVMCGFLQVKLGKLENFTLKKQITLNCSITYLYKPYTSPTSSFPHLASMEGYERGHLS